MLKFHLGTCMLDVEMFIKQMCVGKPRMTLEPCAVGSPDSHETHVRWGANILETCVMGIQDLPWTHVGWKTETCLRFICAGKAGLTLDPCVLGSNNLY